jgi:hypothetical protein
LSVAVFGVSVLFVSEELELAVGFDLSVRLQSDSMAIKSATAKIEFISLAFLSEFSNATALYAIDVGKSMRLHHHQEFG